MIEKCKYCGSSEFEKDFVAHKNGTIHTKVVCRECGKCSGFEQRLGNDDFKMPVGKHEGKTVTEVVKIDRKYAIWASENFGSNNIKRRFKEELEKELVQV